MARIPRLTMAGANFMFQALSDIPHPLERHCVLFKIAEKSIVYRHAYFPRTDRGSIKATVQ